ncbi:endonuclease [Pseudoalteromonas xiamenensis]
MKISIYSPLTGLCVAMLSFQAFSAIPNNYYQSADTSSSTTLKSSLHTIIKGHTKIPYTASTTDTWDVLELADQDPANAANVIDLYKNASYIKAGGGNTNYNREHSWPKSYGFPNDGPDNYPYTDLHHLFIANSSYNSSRNNKPYALCSDAACIVKSTEVNNGRGGGALDISLTLGSGAADGIWQTWPARRGDVARALMYLTVRYEGGVHSTTGVAEPDLELTDNRALIEASNTGGNEATAYMGLKSVLISWNREDPVDDFERRHNEAVFQAQGNRNPFVDHPEYAACIFENQCTGTPTGQLPATPSGFSGVSGDGSIRLTWQANTESNLTGYRITRQSDTSAEATLATVTTTSYIDNSVINGVRYQYRLYAQNNLGNQSTAASTSWLTPATSVTDGIWINELHYDNDGTDVNEGVEVAGNAGLNLNGWQLIAYNGNGGAAYKTVALSGTLSNQSNGFGTASFAISGLQNGGPDGIALVNAANQVVQFISYEGSFTATDGPAKGVTSQDIGLSESTTSPVGKSLQLKGSGTNSSAFTWALQDASFGQINPGQSFGGSTPQEPSLFTNSNQIAIPDNGNVDSPLNVSKTGVSGNVMVSVNITHSYRGDIALTLVAPDGSQYSLKEKNGNDGVANVVEQFSVNSTSNSQGTWTLKVSDNYKQDTGTLNSWSLQFSQ